MEKLLARGAISQQEFEAAKNRILGGEPGVFCTSCGASNSQGARFCFSCGARLVVMDAAHAGAQEETEISKGVSGAKAVRRIGAHTLEVEHSNWTGRAKIRVDGREIISRFALRNTTEWVTVGDRRFMVKFIGGMVPDIKIQEAVETYEPIGEAGADSRFRPRNLALGGLASYAAFLGLAVLGSQYYSSYDPPAWFFMSIILLALGGSILLIAAPIKWLLDRRR
ncbi:MAG: zinc-ribbon domain-containing protein [Euryarchaeota archaeon]|nr:zinc-ribbon domain-containing protein [Euryarchaeota archaeon]